MITKKENEMIIYFCQGKQADYLAKLFKYLYFYQLQTLLDTGNVFFKNCDFIAHTTCPVPLKIWNGIVDETFFSKYPNYEFEKSNFRNAMALNNIRLFKIRSTRKIDIEDFGPAEIQRAEHIKMRCQELLPSTMHENLFFKKSLWKYTIEDGKENTIINLENILK